MVKRLKDAQCHYTVVIREMQIKTVRSYFIPPYCLKKYSLDSFKRGSGSGVTEIHTHSW